MLFSVTGVSVLFSVTGVSVLFSVTELGFSFRLQVLASASGAFGMTPSQICLWDMRQLTCKKVLSHHEHDIVKLSYSRDDRFLVSVGK